MVSAYVGESLTEPDRSGIDVDAQFVDKFTSGVVEETYRRFRHTSGSTASGFELEAVLRDTKNHVDVEGPLLRMLCLARPVCFRTRRAA